MKHYFPHDYNARNDRKLRKLFAKLGTRGIGLYWNVIEMLYEEKGFLPLDDIETIACDNKVTSADIETMLCIEGLFCKDDEKFWSESVLSRLAIIKEKSEKNSRNARKRWDETPEETPEAPETPDQPPAPPKPPKKPKKGEENSYMQFPEIEYVNLMEADFKTLSEKHGERRLLKAIEKLDVWLDKGTKKALEVRGKNHKGHFRIDSWLWEGVDEAVKKDKAKEPYTPDPEKARKAKEQQESAKRQVEMRENICDKQSAINYIVQYYGKAENALKISSVFKEYSNKYGITLEEIINNEDFEEVF